MSAKVFEDQVRNALSRSADTDRLPEVLKVILQHFGAHMGTIHRLDPEDGHLYLVAATEGIPEPVLTASRRIPLGKGIAGVAARDRKPVSICNLQTDTSGAVQPGAKATGAHGALCVPIFQAERVVGTLGIGCNGDRVFTAEETEELLAAGRLLTELTIDD